MSFFVRELSLDGGWIAAGQRLVADAAAAAEVAARNECLQWLVDRAQEYESALAAAPPPPIVAATMPRADAFAGYNASASAAMAEATVVKSLALWRAGEPDAGPAREAWAAAKADVEAFVAALDTSAGGIALGAAKASAANAVELKTQALFYGGFTVSEGPLAGKVLQTRDADDRTNWLTAQVLFSAQVSGGHGADIGAKVRAADNSVSVVSFADASAALLLLAAWGAAILERSWTLKDAIAAVPDIAGLDAIDIEAGWPG